MTDKRREWRKVEAVTSPPEVINKFVKVSEGHELAHKLITESGKTMKEIADCIGITRKMLYTGLSSDRYNWLVLAVFNCLGYEAEAGFNIKTPKGEG